MSKEEKMEIKSKSQFRRITAQLVAKLDEAEALAASRLNLLRRAYVELQRVRDFVDIEPYELMDDLVEELGE